MNNTAEKYVATGDRWGGKIYKTPTSNYGRISRNKNQQKTINFLVVRKVISWRIFETAYTFTETMAMLNNIAFCCYFCRVMQPLSSLQTIYTVEFYASADPKNVARGITFSGCLSACTYVRACVPRRRHSPSPTGSPSISTVTIISIIIGNKKALHNNVSFHTNAIFTTSRA